jgi:hypothetical protein
MKTLVCITTLLALSAACGKAAVQSDTASAAPAPSGSMQPTPAPSMPSATPKLVLDRATYASRDDVKLTLTNDTHRNLGYNACTRVIEREAGAGWTAVPEPDRICTMELRLLARGETVSEQTDLPALAAGRYRIALSFSDESADAGTPVRGVSEPFTVR